LLKCPALPQFTVTPDPFAVCGELGRRIHHLHQQAGRPVHRAASESVTRIHSANFILCDPLRAGRAQSAPRVRFPAQNGDGKRDTKSVATATTTAA
jgi:hypothetical protein